MKLAAAGLALLLVVRAFAPQTMPDGLHRNAAEQLGVPPASDAGVWLDAAAQHEPGSIDAAATAIDDWPAERLLKALDDIKRLEPSDELNAALTRGAMLHADLWLVAELNLEPPPEGWDPSPRAMLVRDGVAVGNVDLVGHVAFGGRVLSAIRIAPGAEEHPATLLTRRRIRQWYRALSASFAARHWLADLRLHLESARNLLRLEAGVLFDTGCLWETLASSAVQAAMPSMEAGVRGTRNAASAVSPGLHLSQAESFYGAAAREDPAMVEARVRRARVLSLRGRHREAIETLQQPIETTDEAVRYYAHLILADALERLGRLNDARHAYRSASKVFPRAQSPLIALSRLARELGDHAEAATVAARLSALPRTEAQRFDPWWVYFDCNGRNVERELRDLRRLFATS